MAELPDKVDVVFVSSFTQAALTAYAVSNLFQQKGAVTVLGGPHARCYPEDASLYFDYVLGFTDEGMIKDILDDPQKNRTGGKMLSASKQP